MQILTNNLFIALTAIKLHPFLSAVVSDDVGPSFEEAPPSPNHSDPDLLPNRHEMDPVPSENTEAEQAPGRQRAVAGSDPMRGLKDFDRVYMPGMKDFVDSICENGLSESRSKRGVSSNIGKLPVVPVGDTGTIPYGMAASFLGAHSDSRPDAGDGCVNKMRAAVGIPSTPRGNAAFIRCRGTSQAPMS